MITFNRVKDNTTSEQKKYIWEWCKDHTENFGGVPMEYIEPSDDDGDDIVLDYDEMLSALTDTQLKELGQIIKDYENSET